MGVFKEYFFISVFKKISVDLRKFSPGQPDIVYYMGFSGHIVSTYQKGVINRKDLLLLQQGRNKIFLKNCIIHLLTVLFIKINNFL